MSNDNDSITFVLNESGVWVQDGDVKRDLSEWIQSIENKAIRKISVVYPPEEKIRVKRSSIKMHTGDMKVAESKDASDY